MTENNSNWERIDAVIKWANMTTNYFARHIGLLRGENLYQIKRGNNGISMALADRIVSKYPQIDRVWLLTGEGSMFADNSTRSSGIPFYDADPEQHITHLARMTPASTICVPHVGQCDLAMRYMGRAMGDTTPAGTVVLLRKIDPEAIILGEEYIVVSRKIVTLRNVRAAEDESRLKLVAGDRDNFDDMTVARTDITTLYKVVAKLIINA